MTIEASPPPASHVNTPHASAKSASAAGQGKSATAQGQSPFLALLDALGLSDSLEADATVALGAPDAAEAEPEDTTADPAQLLAAVAQPTDPAADPRLGLPETPAPTVGHEAALRDATPGATGALADVVSRAVTDAPGTGAVADARRPRRHDGTAALQANSSAGTARDTGAAAERAALDKLQARAGEAHAGGATSTHSLVEALAGTASSASVTPPSSPAQRAAAHGGAATSPAAQGWTYATALDANSANGAGADAVPSFTLDASGSAASSMLADKLSYWVSRGVQNAELSLDALGGAGVDVSIAVQGQDAQVSFLSDAPEARQLLQDSLPQLEKLLNQEGLRLAGAFVGSSGQDGSGSQSRRGVPAAARQAALSRIEEASGTPAARRGALPGGTTGRHVDLFV